MSTKRKAEEQISSDKTKVPMSQPESGPDQAPSKKTCSTCETPQPTTNFWRDKSRSDGLDGRCKDCLSKAKKVSRKQNRRKNNSILTQNPDAFGTHKKCSMCKESLKRIWFSDDIGRSDGKDSRCVDCAGKVNFSVKAAIKAATMKWYQDCGGCQCCKTKDSRVLQAAHRDRKTKIFDPSRAGSVKALMNELAKCVPLCIMCHRKETMGETERTKKKSKLERHTIVNEEKIKRRCCYRCQLPYNPALSQCFDFDHLPGSKKVMSISKMVSQCKPVPMIKSEMKKCGLACANCHMIVTLDRLADHWRIFSRYTGGESIESLAGAFKLPKEKIDQFAHEKMQTRDELEHHYGQNWTDHVVWF